jgi:hypothetical protein
VKDSIMHNDIEEGGAGQGGDAEKIGVRIIKVSERRLHATAILGSFFCADAMLRRWLSQRHGLLDCEFEIHYGDGNVICGAYRFRARGVKQPALTHFVRASARAQVRNVTMRCGAVGFPLPPATFLAAYEIDDLGS